MNRCIRIVPIYRRPLDTKKLALALIALARDVEPATDNPSTDKKGGGRRD